MLPNSEAKKVNLLEISAFMSFYWASQVQEQVASALPFKTPVASRVGYWPQNPKPRREAHGKPNKPGNLVNVSEVSVVSSSGEALVRIIEKAALLWRISLMIAKTFTTGGTAWCSPWEEVWTDSWRVLEIAGREDLPGEGVEGVLWS